MRQVEIKVATPCSEKWDSFEKRGLNGYCGSCEKVVIDFTKMSDAEIKKYFKKTTGDVCGRMRSNQQKAYSTTSNFSFKPFASALMAGSAFLFTGISSFAQEKDQTEQTDKKDQYQSKSAEDSKKKRIVTGIVTDEAGESLPGANVVIKGTTFGTQTDLDGNYRIPIKPEDALVFSFVGFETQEVQVGARSVIDMSLGGPTELGEIIMGGMHYKWFTPRGVWHRIRGLVRRIF